MKNTYFKLFLIITPILVSSFYPEALSMPLLIFLFLQHSSLRRFNAFAFVTKLATKVTSFPSACLIVSANSLSSIFSVSKSWFDISVVSFISSSNICRCIDLSFYFSSLPLSLYGFRISALPNGKN